MGRLHLKDMTTIQLKQQLEEKGLPTMGTQANLEMYLEQGKPRQILLYDEAHNEQKLVTPVM